MIELKQVSAIITIITALLAPILMFKSWTAFIINIVICLISALINKIIQKTINEKIINDEYRKRFKE